MFILSQQKKNGTANRMRQRPGRVYDETSVKKQLKSLRILTTKSRCPLSRTKRQLRVLRIGALGGDESSEGALLQNSIEHH